MPSAWEVTPSTCRWIYAHDGGRIEVRVDASLERHAIDLTVEVIDGPPSRFLISSHIALGGDDGSEPVPVRFSRDGNGIAVTAPPDTDVDVITGAGSVKLALSGPAWSNDGSMTPSGDSVQPASMTTVRARRNERFMVDSPYVFGATSGRVSRSP